MENEELKNKKHVENVNNEKAVFPVRFHSCDSIRSGIPVRAGDTCAA